MNEFAFLNKNNTSTKLVGETTKGKIQEKGHTHMNLAF